MGSLGAPWGLLGPLGAPWGPLGPLGAQIRPGWGCPFSKISQKFAFWPKSALAGGVHFQKNHTIWGLVIFWLQNGEKQVEIEGAGPP